MATCHVGKTRLLVSMISGKQVLSYSSLVIITERITSDSKNILFSIYLGFIFENNKKQTLPESVGSLYLENTVQAKEVFLTHGHPFNKTRGLIGSNSIQIAIGRKLC